MRRFDRDWTMSSATSIDPTTGGSRELRTGPPTGGSREAGAGTDRTDAAFHPWQFFLLAGMVSATGVVIVATGQSPASIILLSLTVVAASLVAIGAYRALAPLVVPESELARPATVGSARAGLQREKTLVLRSIKELEFDFAMGKISKGDFDEMSGKLRARAIGLMRQLDASGGYKHAIEQEVEQRLAKVARDSGPANHPTRATTTCDCGVANDPDARFCKHCGTKLSVA